MSIESVFGAINIPEELEALFEMRFDSRGIYICFTPSQKEYWCEGTDAEMATQAESVIQECIEVYYAM